MLTREQKAWIVNGYCAANEECVSGCPIGHLCNQVDTNFASFADEDLEECLKIIAPELVEESKSVAATQWIGVNERMPERRSENNQVYLSEYVIGFDGERYCVGQFKVYKYDGSRTFFDGYEFTDKITHWMPLPEPPEVGANE